MDRKQFTFYESFASALNRIKSKAARCDAYDAICNFALYGREPDLDSLPDAAAIAFELIRPTLMASKRKAENGKRGGSAEANDKQTASKTEAKAKQTAREKENEKEGEKEKENECSISPIVPKVVTAFDRFWDVYPKKVGKDAARKAFAKVKVQADDLITAVETQKQSAQWKKNNGQFIPNPATWLNQGRWDDELEMAETQNGKMTTFWDVGEKMMKEGML